jgi:hypothetical protein
MPITNEYGVGSTARQDFQRGYLLYNGSVRPYTLRFQNTGTDTWTQGAGSSQVTLVSCDAEFVLKLSTETTLTPPSTVLT